MKLRTFVLSVTALGALFAGATFALRQDEGEMGFPVPKPGPEHALLKNWVGTWDAKVNYGPTTSTGTYVAKLAMGDLWLVEDYQGEMMGIPFTGHGLTGYDLDAKQYLSVWVDSMTTSLEPGRGVYDKEKKELRLSAKGKNPETGEEMTMTSITHFADSDHMTFSMPEMGGFTIEYTRRK